MNYLRVIILIITCFFSTSSLLAQEQYFEWVNPKTTLRERINFNDYTHIKEDSKSNWVAGEVVKSSIVKPIGQKIDLGGDYFLSKGGKEILFTRSGTQTVFSYDTNLGTLNRLDKTIYSGYNFFATEFIRRDTLYRAGGYGFWQFNNIITFFDRSVGEWELIRTKSIGPKTIVGGYQGYEASEDVFYSGASKDEVKDLSLNGFFYSTLFKYDFKTSTWEELGEINSKLPYQTQREIFWTGRYFLQWTYSEIFIIDPVANSVFLYSDPKQVFLKGEQNFIKGDTVFVFWNSRNRIQKISVTDLLNKSKRIGAFYSKSYSNLYYGISLLLLVIFISIYFSWKKARKWKVQTILDSQELILFEALFKLDAGSYLTGNEVNDLLDLYDKGLENQRKVRMNVINQMNQKIKNKYKINDAIQRIVDPSDKRYRLYFLNPQLLSVLKKLK